MTTSVTSQKGAEISPEKYMEILKTAARMGRNAARLTDDADNHMYYRINSGMSSYEDESYKDLDKAIEETRQILSLLEQLKTAKINFDLFE